MCSHPTHVFTYQALHTATLPLPEAICECGLYTFQAACDELSWRETLPGDSYEEESQSLLY